MKIKEIEEAAYQAFQNSEISVEKATPGLKPQDNLYFLQMLNLYILFDAKRITFTEMKKMKQKINTDHAQTDNALRLSQDEYHRHVQLGLDTNSTRTKLIKQLSNGDPDSIHTLLHLLDLYTGENIYDQIYRISHTPITGQELDSMIDECPEEYRRQMTLDEARKNIWRVIGQLNDIEVAEANLIKTNEG